MTSLLKLKSILITVGILTFSTAGFAQTVQDTTLEKLLKLSNTSQLIIQSSHDMKPLFDAQAQDLLKANLGLQTLNKEQQRAAEKISQLLQDTNQEIVSDPKFLNLIKSGYRSTFTEEEAQAYIQFLSTPMGQSINNKSSRLMNDIVKGTVSLTGEIMNDPARQEKFREQMMAIIHPLILK